MQVHFHRHFNRRFAKLPIKIQNKAIERIQAFISDPYNEILRNHILMGKYLGLRSIDITGDFRAIYDPISSDTVLFIDIGTHSQLYK